MDSGKDLIALWYDDLDALCDLLTDEGTPRIERAIQRLKASGRTLSDYITQMRGLIDTQALLTSTLNRHELLEQVIDTVITLTGAERGCIMLYDPTQHDYTIQTARHWNQIELDPEEVNYSKSIVHHVMQERESVLVLNAQDDPRFSSEPSVHAHALRSVMCLPLTLRDEIIGVLYMDNRVTRGVFRESTLSIMRAYAHQVAIAIDNAQMLERLQGDLAESRQEVQRLRINAANAQLPDPLSERELDIIALIAQGLSNQAIADSLVIELSTVKKHINHIYSKLGVESRSQAIVRAHALNLV